MNTKLWINKYKPSSINNIIGHQNQIMELNNWMKDKNNINKSIIISGNRGIGKKLTIELLLKEFNYITNIIYPNYIRNL